MTNTVDKESIDFKEIKTLAKKYSREEIEGCISQQIESGSNECTLSGPVEKVINELSKAEFVRRMVDEGSSLSDAVRDLAKRIRTVQQGFDS